MKALIILSLMAFSVPAMADTALDCKSKDSKYSFEFRVNLGSALNSSVAFEEPETFFKEYGNYEDRDTTYKILRENKREVKVQIYAKGNRWVNEIFVTLKKPKQKHGLVEGDFEHTRDVFEQDGNEGESSTGKIDCKFGPL